jgi:hypothetical protein
MTHTNALFAVCPHDTARGIDKWAMFNTRVNKRLNLGARFHAYLDFSEFRRDLTERKFAWAYLNPADYVKASSTLGYSGIVRPVGRFDVARVIGRDSLAAVHDGATVAAVPGYLRRMVEFALRNEGISATIVDAKSYGEVVTMVHNGRAELGITYNEHFDALASISREGVHAIRSFDMGLSHVIAVRSDLAEAGRELGEWLMADSEGKSAGELIGIREWERIDEAPFSALEAILRGA